MDKPTKPIDLVPRSFGGVKNNFSSSLQSSGYEDGVPAIYGGDNLNYQLDATGKELDYCEKICDFINELPIGKTITTNPNNKLVYTDIVDSANIDLSNLTETGEKHFLNKQQITNCLLEVPQRMDYTLVDGEFTLKAGSVVIVPYGTTDLSSTYIVGTTFINSNLKVVNTEYTDGKFFVWVELQTNVTRASSSGSGSTSARTMALSINDSDLSIVAFINTATVTSDGSAPSSSLFLNTSSNLVKSKQSGTVSGNTCSLPIGTADNDATYNIANINQIYNGLGVIGTTIWADRGVRGLRPNGINNDGTLNNTIFTTLGIQLIQFDTTANAGYRNVTLGASSIGYGVKDNYYYNAVTNRLLYEGGNVSRAIVANFYFNGSSISNFYVYQPLNINTIVDGQWVASNISMIDTSTSIGAETTKEYSLYSYLPNDSYSYEVVVCAIGTTGSTSGNAAEIGIGSSISSVDTSRVAYSVTRTSSTANWGWSGIVPIGTDRKIYIRQISSTACNIRYFRCNAYRRIGSNT